MSDLDILYKRREYLNTRIKDTRIELLRSKNEFKRLCEKFKRIIQVVKLEEIELEFQNVKAPSNLNPFSGNLSFGKTENIFGKSQFEVCNFLEFNRNNGIKKSNANPKTSNPFDSFFDQSKDSFFNQNKGKNKSEDSLFNGIFKKGNKILDQQKLNPFDEEKELVFYEHSTDNHKFN
jgi:hypothetical protein